MDHLLTARWLVPVSSPPILNAGLGIRDGRIVALGPLDEVEAVMHHPRRSDLGDAALLPGFVNVHSHLELTALRGYIEDPDFFRWIRRLTQTKYEVLSPEDLLVSSLWGSLEFTKAGVTTLGDVCDVGVSAAALHDAGLRAVIYQEVFGPDEGQCAESLDRLGDAVERLKALNSPRQTIGVSPHAPYTVSAQLFEKVSQWAREEGLPMCIHSAESKFESEFLRQGTGPFADFLRARDIEWSAPGVSTIEYFESLGVLEAKPLLIHCVDVDDSDLDRISERGCAIVHCPKSNAKFGHGIAPFPTMRRKKITVGVGTDSVASNNLGDLLDEARFASMLHLASDAETWTARDTLRLATLDGARALGLGEEIGSLEIGKLADVIAIDLSSPHMRPLHDVEAAIAWSAGARDVIFSMVEGEVLLANRICMRLDEAELGARLDSVAAKCR